MRFFILFFAFSLSLGAKAESSSFMDQQVYPVLKKGSDQTSGLTFLSGVLSVVAAHTQDEYTRNSWKEHQVIDKNTAHVGDLIGTGAASALAIGAQYFFDDDESNYQSHLRGFIYGGVSIYILKTLGNRQRPGNSRNYQSFPSGHTAITFMSATSLTYAYGWKAAVIAYPIAAFTAATRLSDDVHWFSDTVAGAFLGFLVGRATYYDQNEIQRKKQEDEVTWMLLPQVNQGQFELSAYISL